MTAVGSVGLGGGKPLLSMLKPLTAAESYQQFRRLLTPVYAPDTPETSRAPERDPLIKAQFSTCVSVDTPSGRVDISNAGYVGSDFDVGQDWWSHGMGELSGPDRAIEIAKRLVERFGGSIEKAATAVSQQEYDALTIEGASGRWSTADVLGSRTQNAAHSA